MPFQSWASAGDSRQSSEISGFTFGADAGVHFVNATNYLEGDGLLIFSCYERLSAVSHAVAVDHYPNTSAVAREIACVDAALYIQLILQAKACIKPGLQFYQQKFSGNIVREFKAARLYYPVQVQSVNPTAESLEEFRNLPFINDDTKIANLAVWSFLHILQQLMVSQSLVRKTKLLGGRPMQIPSRIGLHWLRRCY